MKSNRTFSRLFAASCIMASFATASTVYATTAPVVLDLEGNPTCSSLVENSIFEMKDTSPPVGGSETLTLHNGEELTYTINPDGGSSSGDTVTIWTLSEVQPLFPINFIILKGAGNSGARVFHYGQQGVTSDTDLEGPGTLKAVTFCYGLDGEEFVEETVQNCDYVGTGGDNGGFTLEGIKIDCSLTSNQGVSFHSIKKGGTLTYSECTCNKVATVCDKSLPPGTTGACLEVCPEESSGAYDTLPGFSFDGEEFYESEVACLHANALKEVPVGGIEPWNNGSGWCSSFSGSSSCKKW